MCCAMTSPQHLVALPSLSSALHPPCSAGHRSLLSTAGGTVALSAQTGQGKERCAAAAVVVVRPLCPRLHWVPCAPLAFCFFSYAAVMQLAGCPSVLLSLGSQLLIRGKAPSRTKSMSRHLTRLSCWLEKHRLQAQAKSNNDMSPCRPPTSVQKIQTWAWKT